LNDAVDKPRSKRKKMDALQKYATAVAMATTMEEISSAKDEYIKDLEGEIFELKKKALLVKAFVNAYVETCRDLDVGTKGYFEIKNGEKNSPYFNKEEA
jgi:hypothetical protein